MPSRQDPQRDYVRVIAVFSYGCTNAFLACRLDALSVRMLRRPEPSSTSLCVAASDPGALCTDTRCENGVCTHTSSSSSDGIDELTTRQSSCAASCHGLLLVVRLGATHENSASACVVHAEVETCTSGERRRSPVSMVERTEGESPGFDGRDSRVQSSSQSANGSDEFEADVTHLANGQFSVWLGLQSRRGADRASWCTVRSVRLVSYSGSLVHDFLGL